ncbi:MAG: ribonuclease HI family protein [Candidatus Methanomethylicia archaeon]|nr:ribonuclease HI family protein [Candidatus Methanomethylicia archaeon]
MNTLYFDGLCEPRNPGGVATYGFVLFKGSSKLCEGKGFVGAGMFGDDVTNNVAEYFALIKGMECAISHKLDELVVKGDSQLVIMQMRGAYAVRASRLLDLNRRARELALKFKKVSFEWVPRDENAEADMLSRAAFKEFLKSHESEYGMHYRRIGEGV